MSDKFIDSSEHIANDFLQSILFIDDQAYQPGFKNNEFNPYEISKVFAKEQKICSVINPTKESDLNDIIQISKKADVIVIDWRLNLQSDVNAGDDEEDDVDDHRGAYTLGIIRDIFSDPLIGKTGLKMILIYTGETNLIEITDKIHQELSKISNVTKGDFEIIGSNFKVLIVGKSSLSKVRVKEIKKRAKKYDELPDFILTDFPK